MRGGVGHHGHGALPFGVQHPQRVVGGVGPIAFVQLPDPLAQPCGKPLGVGLPVAGAAHGVEPQRQAAQA